MNNEISQNSLLETAWRRYAVLDENAVHVQKQYMRMRWQMAVLGVLAVLFAILVDNFYSDLATIPGIVFRGLLILTPILLSILAAFGNKFQQGQKYLTYRAAAEGILKEIYTFRVANKNKLNREKILSDRLAAIQRDLFRGAGGELVLKEYTGTLPPYHDPENEASDAGFADLSGDDYLKFRLQNQLSWHTKKNLEMQRSRKAIQWSILIFGGIGAFLAAWGGSLAVWVALTAAIASALVGWEELRGLDMRVGNYSQVILELHIIRDWWFTVRSRGATDDDAAELALKTEKVLFDQNLEWVSAMRKALASAEGDDAALVGDFVQEGREATTRIQENLFTEVEEITEGTVDAAAEAMRGMFSGMTAINEDEINLPPEELVETTNVAATIDPSTTPETFEPAEAVYEDKPMMAGATDDFYEPEPEPVTVDSTVDAAIAESALFASTSEAVVDDNTIDDFEDEDFGEDEAIEADDEFVDEDFGDDENDEFANEGDFLDELWDDEAT